MIRYVKKLIKNKEKNSNKKDIDARKTVNAYIIKGGGIRKVNVNDACGISTNKLQTLGRRTRLQKSYKYDNGKQKSVVDRHISSYLRDTLQLHLLIPFRKQTSHYSYKKDNQTTIVQVERYDKHGLVLFAACIREVSINGEQVFYDEINTREQRNNIVAIIDGDEMGHFLELLSVFKQNEDLSCTQIVASLIDALLMEAALHNLRCQNDIKKKVFPTFGKVYIQSLFPCKAFNCYNRAFRMNGFEIVNGSDFDFDFDEIQETTLPDILQQLNILIDNDEDLKEFYLIFKNQSIACLEDHKETLEAYSESEFEDYEKTPLKRNLNSTENNRRVRQKIFQNPKKVHKLSEEEILKGKKILGMDND